MDEENPNLPGIKTANHSNLGKKWERQLELTHDWYRLQRTVDIVHNPNEWRYATEGEYLRVAARSPESVAMTKGGRYLVREVNSNIDFSGGNGKRAYAFDAKSSKGERFALSNVKEGQVHRLKEASRCGVTAGLMLLMTELERVFFIPVDWLERKMERYRVQAVRRHAAPGTASISLDELIAHAVEIERHPINGMWDWYLHIEGQRD